MVGTGREGVRQARRPPDHNRGGGDHCIGAGLRRPPPEGCRIYDGCRHFAQIGKSRSPWLLRYARVGSTVCAVSGPSRHFALRWLLRAGCRGSMTIEEAFYASGVGAGRPDRVLDADRRGRAADREQERRDAPRLRVATEVLRARGALPAPRERVAASGGRVRRRSGGRAGGRAELLPLVGEHDRVPPLADPRGDGLPRGDGRRRAAAVGLACGRGLPDRVERRPAARGAARPLSQRADRAARRLARGARARGGARGVRPRVHRAHRVTTLTRGNRSARAAHRRGGSGRRRRRRAELPRRAEGRSRPPGAGDVAARDREARAGPRDRPERRSVH